jgi:hypothetical protein
MARRRNKLAAIMTIAFLISAVVAVYEYTVTQDLTRQIQQREQVAIVVYNIPGVAIPVVCCPRFTGSIAVGDYLFNSSDSTPLSDFYINGTRYPGGDGTMLLFEVASFSAPTTIENASFIWRGTFNESTPFPMDSSIFGGHVVFHWYVDQELLYVHIQTA